MEVQGQISRRPLPSASACRDNDQNGLCNALFVNNDPNDLANNANPTKPYKVHEDCFKATHSSIATKFCASTCALCCKTPQFSGCPDSKSFFSSFFSNEGAES
ncbi:unnamed protein product [Dracunculus medinensis]|uniref:ShKT domain-containing protein n=1 Tax=Dracunculus medinensis TaxID=318479 RepID=A0A0N4US18_DRAME|nr:unnamed protein product [Dracunculus medinensis]